MSGFDLGSAPDLGALEDEGQTIHLRDVNDEPMMYDSDGGPKPVTITVVGTYSATYIAMQKAQTRRMSKRFGRGGDLMDIAEANALESLAVCTKAWDGFFTGGVPFPCTKENAMTLYASSKAQHIRRQVEQAMGDHESFFKRQPTI